MHFSNNHSNSKKKWYYLLLLPIVFFALGYAVMLLWNAVLPVLFQFPNINFWQATGLLILCRILFGSFKFGWHKHHDSKMYSDWSKCSGITDEEKQKFKEEWKKRCGSKELK